MDGVIDFFRAPRKKIFMQFSWKNTFCVGATLSDFLRYETFTCNIHNFSQFGVDLILVVNSQSVDICSNLVDFSPFYADFRLISISLHKFLVKFIPISRSFKPILVHFNSFLGRFSVDFWSIQFETKVIWNQLWVNLLSVLTILAFLGNRISQHVLVMIEITACVMCAPMPTLRNWSIIGRKCGISKHTFFLNFKLVFLQQWQPTKTPLGCN